VPATAHVVLGIVHEFPVLAERYFVLTDGKVSIGPASVSRTSELFGTLLMNGENNGQ
jgi:hypothetical protein